MPSEEAIAAAQALRQFARQIALGTPTPTAQRSGNS
jgi:hypothetical protein